MTRLSKLQAKIQASDLDGLLVTDPVNVGYLTGFTGDESGLLVGETGAWFITDSRFTTQAKQQVTNATLVIHTHGVLRKAAELADDQGMQAVGFESEYMTFADYQKLGAQCSWTPTTNLVASLREVKDDAEIAKINQAIAIAEAGYQHVLETIHARQTELAVATDLDFFMRGLGASGTSFDTIVASGARSAMPHGAATDKVIEAGDVITLDWGCIYDGYMSDLTRTFAVGTPDDRISEIYRIVYAANQAVTKLMAPGVTGRQLNDCAHNFIDEAGYGQYFGHGTGHGIGLSIHEGPGAWNGYLDVPQVAGNVETNEPGIYLPGIGGVRIEDDLLVTETGNEVLSTPAPKEILVVGE